MKKLVKDIMTKDVVTIDGDKKVLDAARIMKDRHIGCLIVTLGKVPIGIITERDLVSRVLAEPFDPSKVLVKDIMTTPIFTISSEETLEKAAEIMVKYQIRRLPVVDNDKLVGIITANDLAKVMVQEKTQEEVFLKAIARYSEVPKFGPYA